MKIEKVSKYVPVYTPSRSTEVMGVRHMLMSIPRIKWLEKEYDENLSYFEYSKEDDKLQPRILTKK